MKRDERLYACWCDTNIDENASICSVCGLIPPPRGLRPKPCTRCHQTFQPRKYQQSCDKCLAKKLHK